MTTNPNLQTLLQQGHNQIYRGNNQATSLEPQNPKLLYNLGLTRYWPERHQQAVDYLNQALTIQPNYILALVHRGLADKELKEIQL